MWSAIIGAIMSLLEIFIIAGIDKANEPTTATDAPKPPRRVRDAWADRVRRFKSRIRTPK